MIIIIEGIDGSGKSTLAEELSKEFNIPVVHNVKPKDGENILHKYLKIMREHNYDVILDRGWISNMVYGDVMKDQHTITQNEFNLLCNLAFQHDGFVIFCGGGDIQALFDRARTRGEEYIQDYETFEKLYHKFGELVTYTQSFMPVITHEIKN